MKRYNFFPGRNDYDRTISWNEYRLLLNSLIEIIPSDGIAIEWRFAPQELFTIDDIREDEHSQRFIHWLTNVSAFALKYSSFLKTK